MSSTSPNFNLILATASDTVDVAVHVAGPLSTLDSILAVVHTGTGQLKNNLTLQSPILVNPTITGTSTAPSSILAASTGLFSTITATAGIVTGLSSFGIGTYTFPTVIGATSQVLTVSAGQATWQTQAPNTGANQALSNIGPVAINTNLNTFSAGFVTVNRLLTTSGALTGLTVFQATTGTFNSNVTITGTLTASIVNCTGGAITAGGITIGTYALPSTIGSTNQVLTVTTGNAVWGSAGVPGAKLISATSFSGTTGSPIIVLSSGRNYLAYIQAAPASTDTFRLVINADQTAGRYLNAGLTVSGGVVLNPNPVDATKDVLATVYFRNMLVTTADIIMQGQCVWYSGGGSIIGTQQIGAAYLGTAVATGFTIISSTGTNMTGIVNLYELVSS